jgi:P-type Cu2+ transporter
MKTATLDVGGMLSMLDYQAVEKQLGRIPGVQRATASIASNSVTVEYDETVTNVGALKDKVNECGFHCTGQTMPKHVCEPHPGMPVSRGAPMKLAGSRPLSAATHPMPESHVHAPAGAPAAATPAVPISHEMAHEMGHGAGMDMQAMVRDMRNRFWISLVFSVPIFAYSPMGMDFVRLSHRPCLSVLSCRIAMSCSLISRSLARIRLATGFLPSTKPEPLRRVAQ